MRVSIWRWAVMLSGLALMLAPMAAEAWVVDIAGTWDTHADVNSGPDAGATFDGWIHFSQGRETVTGTFQATIGGVLTNGTIHGTQTDGRFHGVFAANSPDPYQLTLEATINSDGATFSGTWSDNQGRSGTYDGVRRTWETTGEDLLPQAGGRTPWNLLLASWALLGAAMLSRGARKHLEG